jgi:DnaJ-class molecular chaperone
MPDGPRNCEQLHGQIWLEISRAYNYLENPTTKVIYDEFGIVGLAAYEREKKQFLELQD